jgi:hypothetical protein
MVIIQVTLVWVGFNLQQNMPEKKAILLWKLLFFSVLGGYCLLNAPYGVNETDGGFLTGLAWQVLEGKTLYRDIVYVRPPLPVLLRAGELLLLPDQWGVIGERYVFFLKVAAYSWLAAAVLASGARRWVLAVFGFVVSVHCYPPMAWHTVDGILFAVLAVWCFVGNTSTGSSPGSIWRAVLAGAFVFAAILCKQSFYPMTAVFVFLLFMGKNAKKAAFATAGFTCCLALFWWYIDSRGLLSPYLDLTCESASISQAFQRSVLDFFRIKPWLALLSAPFIVLALLHLKSGKYAKTILFAWPVWLALLMGSYALEVWCSGEFTAPFAQARLMFWVGMGWWLWQVRQWRLDAPVVALGALLAVSWCASVSWGYNLPIMFSTPWVFGAMEVTRAIGRRTPVIGRLVDVATLVVLLVVFRWGYEFVYRDGRRSEMDTPMSRVFPQMSGIYSNSESGQLYLELRTLAIRYPNFTVLPSFTQANYLTKTFPPLPLDWVVRREMNGDSTYVLRALQQYHPVLLFEKKHMNQMASDPEMALVRTMFHSGTVIDETQYFWVVQSK